VIDAGKKTAKTAQTTERLRSYTFVDDQSSLFVLTLSPVYSDRLNSTQQTSLIELSRIGRYEQDFKP